MTNSTKCPQCGLINLASVGQCRRCGLALTPGMAQPPGAQSQQPGQVAPGEMYPAPSPQSYEPGLPPPPPGWHELPPPYAAAPGFAVHPGGINRFEDVPWYRRSDLNSVFVVAGWFLCPPLLWSTCIMLLTGEIYQNKYDFQGKLVVWGKANKVVAAVLLALNLVFFVYGVVQGVLDGMK